jgi:hydrogenase nickel incorporation protein HypA/HybF
MHEFSICEGIVDAVIEELGRLDPAPRKLEKARVVVGVLRQIVPDYLTFAYETLTKGTAAEGSVLDVVQAPAKGTCGDCSWEGDLSPGSYKCGGCGSVNLEMTGGTDLYLESLEVEDGDTQR